MSYEINPMSDEELEKSNLAEKGIYDFEVIRKIDKVSPAGNKVAKLTLTIWEKQGRSYYVYDNLVFSSAPLCLKKIKHFCSSTNIEEDYKCGKIREELERLLGKVEIGYQEPQPKEGGGHYPAKNVVIDYVTSDNASQNIVSKENIQKEDFADEIPF